ncbi:MAG: YlbF family regulator [Halanaerobiaceae bacterium]
MSVKEKAEELAEEIIETEEYQELKKAEENMHDDEEAENLLNEYQSTQQRLQMAQSNGQNISSQQQKKFQNLQTKMQSNSEIKNFMEKQQEFNKVMQEVNQTISSYLGGNNEQ